MKFVDIFNKYLHYGGEELVVHQIGAELQMAGHEVVRCHFDSASWKGEGAPSKLKQLRNLFYNKDSAAIIRACIEKEKPDALIVHNVFPVASPAVYMVAKELDVPVIQFVHNFRPFSVGGSLYAKGHFCERSLEGKHFDEIKRSAWQGSIFKSFLMSLVLKKLLRTGSLENVKAWVCISEYMKSSFKRAGIEEKKLHVIRHSWRPENKDGITDEGYYLFLGRLTEEKGVSVLMECWQDIQVELGDLSPTLVIAGDGPLEGEVRRLSSINDKIEYVGLIKGGEKEKYIAGCRAMLAPSVWKEPLGLVTYEAQEYTKVMFASSSGGLEETTEDGVTGFLHSAGNAKQLASQILKFESMDENGKKSMGRAARERLDREASVAGWLKKFNEVTNTLNDE